MTISKYKACSYNVLNQTAILCSSLAYLTYMGNWLSLTLALSAGPADTPSWKRTFLFWFKPLLYTFMAGFVIFSMAATITFCDERIPRGLSLSIQTA